MTFLAPLFFYVALAVAAGVVGLHFIVTRQPTSSPLPTVRFVPTSQVRVTTVAPRPEDLLLLAARVLAVLLIGAALARPVLVPRRRPLEHIVVADVSRDAGSMTVVRDSARALLGQGGVLVAFDSAARVVGQGSEATAAAGRLTGAARAGRLSPALIAALRAASRTRDEADSFALDIVSPVRASEMDGATGAIRALWPGRIHVVPVAAAADSLAPPAGISVRAPAGDPVALAAGASGIPVADSAVRVVRGAASAGDSIWVAGGRRTLVRWPATGAPPGFAPRSRPDTVDAVVAEEAALVYPLVRRWQLDTMLRPARVAARWVDGQPAAIERAVGAGCIREVAIPVPSEGDLVLRPEFARFLRELVAPCRTAGTGPAVSPAALRALAGSGPLARHDAIPAPDTIATPLVPWLLGAALLLILLEPLLRRGSAPHWTRAELDRAVRDVEAGRAVPAFAPETDDRLPPGEAA